MNNLIYILLATLVFWFVGAYLFRLWSDSSQRGRHQCSKCRSHDTHWGIYIRAYNDLCQQAAGEEGHYCMNCMNIDFKTPDFEKWLTSQPRWIVRKHGDSWR